MIDEKEGAMWEYYKKRFSGLADRLAKQIEYDYEKQLDKCRKKMNTKEPKSAANQEMPITKKQGTQIKTVCMRNVPGWTCLMASDENGKRKELRTEDTIFLLNRTNCNDGSEIHTVREWLEAFGIPVEDKFFVKWQNIVLELSETFRKTEKKMGMDAMQMAWSTALRTLYLRYDTTKEFLPQFEENSKNYLRMLHKKFQV